VGLSKAAPAPTLPSQPAAPLAAAACVLLAEFMRDGRGGVQGSASGAAFALSEAAPALALWWGLLNADKAASPAPS